MEEQKKLLELLDKNSSINEIQEYIRKVIELRGFSNKKYKTRCYTFDM